MSVINVDKFYERSDFTALPGGVLVNEGVLSAAIAALALANVPDAVIVLVNTSALITVQVHWSGTPPTAADIAAITAVVAAHVGTATSSAPIQLAHAAAVQATTATLVTVIDSTTPPLDSGTYLVTTASQLNMLAVVAATFTQAIFTITVGGVAVQVSQTNVPSQTQVVSFDPAAMVAVAAGGTLRIQIQIAKVGAAAATAQATATRASIAKVA